MKVTLNNITKVYKGNDNAVIKGLNVEIESGELVSVVGPSGCGKSTTLYMIAGLEEVTDGQILFGDRDVTHITADKREIGLVFQNYALYPHLTVLKNVMFPLTNTKLPKDEIKARALEIIDAVGLNEHIDKYPKELSGGQQQRVAIARAIVKYPDVLLLDEPLSNLDAKLKMSTILEIKKIQRQFNITTIFVTHDQQEAMAISDQMIVLNEGIVMQKGKPNELYRKPKNEFIAHFIGAPSINTFEVDLVDGVIQGMEKLIERKVPLKDGKYVIGIRPEALKRDENGYEAAVQDLEVLGRDILLYTDKFNVLIGNTNESFNGTIDSICVKARNEEIHFFDVETKETINVSYE